MSSSLPHSLYIVPSKDSTVLVIGWSPTQVLKDRFPWVTFWNSQAFLAQIQSIPFPKYSGITHIVASSTLDSDISKILPMYAGYQGGILVFTTPLQLEEMLRRIEAGEPTDDLAPQPEPVEAPPPRNPRPPVPRPQAPKRPPVSKPPAPLVTPENRKSPGEDIPLSELMAYEPEPQNIEVLGCSTREYTIEPLRVPDPVEPKKIRPKPTTLPPAIRVLLDALDDFLKLAAEVEGITDDLVLSSRIKISRDDKATVVLYKKLRRQIRRMLSAAKSRS